MTPLNVMASALFCSVGVVSDSSSEGVLREAERQCGFLCNWAKKRPNFGAKMRLATSETSDLPSKFSEVVAIMVDFGA